MFAAGAMQEDELSREITSSDHPFLRANVNSIQEHRKAIKRKLVTRMHSRCLNFTYVLGKNALYNS